MTDSPSADDIRRFALQLGSEERLLPGSARKPAVTLIEASALEREADEIARRIVALHDRGTPFREIGVALRDAGAYLSLLRGTFERFGIPAHFYFSSPLRRHPVATFLGGLISGALNDWNFEAAIETLRAHPRWGRSADFDRFDFAVREAMPGHGAAALLQLCEQDWLREEIARLPENRSLEKHSTKARRMAHGVRIPRRGALPSGRSGSPARSRRCGNRPQPRCRTAFLVNRDRRGRSVLEPGGSTGFARGILARRH